VTDAGNEGSDRRLHPRIDSLHLISYVNKEDGVQQTPVSVGRVLDISAGGARIEVLQDIAVDSEMEMDVAIRETKLQVHGKVVRTEPGDQSGTWVAGIQFDHEVPDLDDHL